MKATSVIQNALSGFDRSRPASPPGTGRASGVVKLVRPLLGSLTATRVGSDGLGVRHRAPSLPLLRPSARVPDVKPGSAEQSIRGRFIDGVFANAGSQLRYKLYIPGKPASANAPMVVLLHGCKQDPDDFAAGTGMNLRAEQQGFYVLYPAQSATANPSRCWNWFNGEDQQRGKGEPAMIAGMTREVVATYGIDPDRVYVAGLSAGGAMAAIVTARYPDVFAAVGVHSGLPAGAASNLPDALAAMRTGSRRSKGVAPLAAGDAATPARFVPTIVFHGDGDTTVHPVNGQSVIDDALRTSGTAIEAHAEVAEGVSARGKRYTVSKHRLQSGAVMAEHWVVHDSPHAWSGGSRSGSFTDMDGPSATDEMLRFFDEHDPQRRAGLHG